MQAQRKFEQPAPPSAARDEEWSPPLAGAVSGAAAPSPAHLLWEELALRLQPGHPQPSSAVESAAAKWPMSWRIATVVGLSALCWGGLYMIVASVF